MTQPEPEADPVREAFPAAGSRFTPTRGYRVDDYLDDGRDLDGVERVTWPAAAGGDEAPVLEYSGDLEAEVLWGPRPRLMADEPGGRRTVVITGRVADRHIAPRAGVRDHAPSHLRFPADRTAMWAVLLCVIVLLVAITSH